MQPPSEVTPLGPNVEIPREISITQLGRYFGFRVFHVWLFLGASLAILPASATVGTAPYLLEVIQHELGIEDSMLSLAHTGLLLGSFPGVLLCGWACDHYGRRFTILGCMCLITGLNLLYLLIPAGPGGVPYLLTLRIALGIPYGGLLNLPNPYVIEFISDEMRGAAVVLLGASWLVGHMISLATIQVIGAENWRLCSAAAPASPFAVGLFVMRLLPESPRWLRVAGFNEESQRVLDTIFASRPVVGQAFVGTAPEITLELARASNSSMSPCNVLRELRGPPLMQVMLVTTTSYATFYSLHNTVETWGPHILELVSGEDDVGLGVFSCAAAVGVVTRVFVASTVDTLGRRLYLGSASFMLAVISASFGFVSTLGSAKALWVVRNVMDTALCASLDVYMGEAFPTCLRGSAVGISTGLGRLLSVLLPMLFGGLLEVAPIGVLMLGVASAYLGGFLTSFLIPAETAKTPTKDTSPSRSA